MLNNIWKEPSHPVLSSTIEYRDQLTDKCISTHVWYGCVSDISAVCLNQLN